MSEWEPPRCSHGRILLGCPDDDCPEQNAYLSAQERTLVRLEQKAQADARRLVCESLGLPMEENG